MERERMWAALGVVLAAVSAVIGLAYGQSVMSVLSVIALLLSGLSLRYCADDTQRYVLIMSVTVLICTLVMSIVLTQERLADASVGRMAAMHAAGLIYTIPVMPMVMVFLFVTAAAFGGTLNWFLTSAFSAFIGLGMFAPAYAAMLFLQWPAVDSGIIENADVVTGLMSSLIMLIAFAIVLLYTFRKNRYLITKDGIVRDEGRTPMHLKDILGTAGERTEDGVLTRSDRIERRVSWILLIAGPIGMLTVYAYVTAGLAPGIGAGHPMDYLQNTCLMWAIITAILPALRLARIVSLPMWFMILLNAVMFFYVISLCQGLFLSLDRWGNISHEVASFIVASIVFLALCMMERMSPPHVTLGSRGGVLAMLFLLSASFGCIWEIAEGYTDILSGRDLMVYGIEDTLQDLCADLIGIFVLSVIAWFILRKQTVDEVGSRVRLGRGNIDIPVAPGK